MVVSRRGRGGLSPVTPPAASSMGIKRRHSLATGSGAMYEGRDGPEQPRSTDDGRRSPTRTRRKGSLADVLKGADVFIGVSAPGMPDRRKWWRP